jgi:Autophagy protein Apg5
MESIRPRPPQMPVPLAIFNADAPERPPLLLLHPRDAPLALVGPAALTHFHERASMAAASFTLRGRMYEPLSLTTAVGLILDLSALSSNAAAGPALPLTLDVRFSQAASEDESVSGAVSDARSALFTRLKEASVLACGSAAPVQALPPEANEGIWGGLGDLTRASNVHPAVQRAVAAAGRSWREARVPVRLYAKVRGDDGIVSTSSHAAPSNSTIAAALHLPEGAQVVVAGIRPPERATLGFLHRRLAQADNFLHVCALLPP